MLKAIRTIPKITVITPVGSEEDIFTAKGVVMSAAHISGKISLKFILFRYFKALYADVKQDHKQETLAAITAFLNK